MTVKRLGEMFDNKEGTVQDPFFCTVLSIVAFFRQSVTYARERH